MDLKHLLDLVGTTKLDKFDDSLVGVERAKDASSPRWMMPSS